MLAPEFTLRDDFPPAGYDEWGTVIGEAAEKLLRALAERLGVSLHESV
jgi:hypothetical protein